MRKTITFPKSFFVRASILEEFFGQGKEEKASPFLTPSSRYWAANLTLKASIFAAFLLVIAFGLSFFPSYVPLSHFLLVAVYFFAGVPALIESVEDLKEYNINIDVLMTLAAFSSVLIGSSLEGALLLVLFALSGSIEDSVTAKAKGSLSQLHKLSPTKATVLGKEGHLLERSVKDIKVGTLILVRAGEVVPLDGKVVEGISSLNLVHLTGENMPVTKQVGDDVPAGARNLEGTLTVQVTHANADSTLAKIIQMVTQAQEAKPTLQRWFDRLSRGYAMSIISLSVFFGLSFPFFLSIPYTGYEGSIYRAIAFLIAASPCALILALPIAYLSAVSACAHRGILLKGGITLDALSQCSTIAFDKTGTLTTGILKCGEILEDSLKSKELSKDDLLTIAYTLEKNVVHPIAQAISAKAMEKNLQTFPLENFRSIPGYGVEAKIKWKEEWHTAYMGKIDYIITQLSSEQQTYLQAKLKDLQEQGQLVTLLFFQGKFFLFTFQDTIRPNIFQTLQRLKKMGNWKLVMLTGDHEYSAKKVAQTLEIDSFYANLKPEDKLRHVTELSKSQGLAMVGDGINDAPALARATVGICMGKIGSGTAIDAADVILLQDDLDLLDWLLKKARQTQRIVRQNLSIAAGAILLASLPALAGFVPLWVAVIMHEGGTVLVGLNALRLLR